MCKVVKDHAKAAGASHALAWWVILAAGSVYEKRSCGSLTATPRGLLAWRSGGGRPFSGTQFGPFFLRGLLS
jgi:hypothetical protein